MSNNPLTHYQFKQTPASKFLRVLHLRNTHRTLNSIPPSFEECPNLQELDLAMNDLPVLPQSLHVLTNLRKLDLSHNKLTKIEFPEATTNLLLKECPEDRQISATASPILVSQQFGVDSQGIGRCVKLQRLRLDNNRLITLPDGIHLLPDLKELDLHNNDEVFMPPKPSDKQKAMAFYNIDFSLTNQLRLAGQNAVQRKKDFIKRRRCQADADGASKVIQGMSQVAKASHEADMEEMERASRPAVSWKDKMEQTKPRLDYSDVFDENVGNSDGLWVWEIENFYPQLVDPSSYGQFYEADCYLVLKTTKEPSGSLSHAIFYWIGEKTTLDKGMCAAVHAVNLRNHLGLPAEHEEIVYYNGARTQSGFFTVEKSVFVKKLYRASVNGPQIDMETVLSVQNPWTPDMFFCWMLEKLSGFGVVPNLESVFCYEQRDRKAKAEIESCNQLKTPEEFWTALTGSPKKPEEPIVEHVPADFVPERKKLYLVQMGMGFLELPQVELKHGVLKMEMLQTKDVYILDSTSEIFLWVGKKANRMVKMAGQKMVVELHRMLERPDYTSISREAEGEESTIFRSKFTGWDDIVPFDFTMTADTVQRRGADIKVIMERDKMKTDLVALFLDRLPAMSHEDADQMIEECNEDLEVIEPFVLEGKKFVRLPNNEFGTFYTMDCYVFLCRYYVVNEESDVSDEEDDSEHQDGQKGGAVSKNSNKNEEDKADDFKYKLEVVRMYQQQENHKFLSHFKKKFVIRKGRRNLSINMGGKWPELFHMRANGSAVCTRTIQIDCKADKLNSAFCYIVRYPFAAEDDQGNLGKVFVWLGSKCDPYYYCVAEQVANELINRDEEFRCKKWRRAHTRLFRCTNDKGFFSVSEKTVDFCQDDLDDEDVMIVDSGQFIFLWLGSKSSEVEVKLAYKAAQVYCGHMQMKETDRPRKLMLSIKGRESKRFTRLFHGWGKHKVPAGD
uniref:Gelsolin-like domain-containing protein n=1 Tax=Ditylenchus dipsaci TaxID=166011 RepID=A0A915EFX3_9BILA